MGTAAHTDPAGDRQWKAQLGRTASRRARAEAEFYAAAAEVDARVPQTEIAAVCAAASRQPARPRRDARAAIGN